jgi:predicted transcriptional regulator
VAQETLHRAVLMPIKPKYAESILDGRKRVEFRKVAFRQDISCVIVYASSPTKMVTGFFEVSGFDCDSPDRLWSRHGAYGGISRKDFLAYYSNRSKGVAIEVKKAWTLDTPISLADIAGDMHVPQSFAYVGPEVVRRLTSMKKRLAGSSRDAVQRARNKTS